MSNKSDSGETLTLKYFRANASESKTRCHINERLRTTMKYALFRAAFYVAVLRQLAARYFAAGMNVILMP